MSTAHAAEALVASPTLSDDVSRLRAAQTLPSRTGGKQFKVMEDIWMGSVIFRRPPQTPVTFVALSERDDNTLVSDGWGLKVTRSSIVVHVKNHMTGVQLERFLATHAYKNASHCEEGLRVSCAVGCRAFLSRQENQTASRNPQYDELWGGRIDRASFCNGMQSNAAYCRVGATKPRHCEKKPVDLLKHDQYVTDTIPRAKALLAQTQQLVTSAESYERISVGAAGRMSQRA